jgi:hypothetical protein
MHRSLPRKLAIAGLFSVLGLATACPPPFWRHERRDDRRERHDDHGERRDDHKDRQERKERGH